jgi:hypothetical protein
MNNRHASFNHSRPFLQVGITLLILLIATPGLAKSSKKADFKGKKTASCSVTMSLAEIALLDGIGEGYSDTVEVHHTVDGAEASASLVTLANGVSQKVPNTGKPAIVNNVPFQGTKVGDICTQVTLFGAAADGSDLVGFSCISAPLACGMGEADLVNDIALCMDHQVGVDGSCTDMVATLRATYRGQKASRSVLLGAGSHAENNDVDPNDPCASLDLGPGTLVGIRTENEDMACPYYDSESQEYVMGTKTKKTTVFICGYVTGPCHQGCHGWVEHDISLEGSWGDCEPNDSGTEAPTDDTEEGSGDAGDDVLGGGGPL